MPVTVVPTSFATVAIDTFITELSSVMRNWPAASVMRTSPAPAARADGAAVAWADAMGGSLAPSPDAVVTRTGGTGMAQGQSLGAVGGTVPRRCRRDSLSALSEGLS